MPETPRPKRAHRPGHDPLPDERLTEIRAEVDDNDGRGLRLQEAIELLGELDRIRPLLATTLDANSKLLDEWGRYVGVAATIGGVFCRTCRTEVQPGTEGCPRHSPTVIGRELYRLHDESRALPTAERNARAYELLDTVLPLLAAVLNPVDHAEGCRPHDCQCACDRRQNCQDCHRCVCWRAQCCAEKAIRWHAEDRWARLVAAAGHGPEGSAAEDDGPRCAACRTPIAKHQGRHCQRPATPYC